MRAACEQGAPFDGVLGFSNGAAAAAVLLSELHGAGGVPAPRFAILCAGFLPPALVGAPRLPIASLHVVGRNDKRVPLEQARQLQGLFVEPEELLHEREHLVPQRSPETEAVASWLSAWSASQRPASRGPG
ncbi:unnamed protein product [Prorocentrum cordatum]|uniref:Serine hydrolase domain-containing protein n=1 Tax=Prorocentrum cordatum TaxID=2364126 RepID=A0ABN9QRA2_9DINO|nr:unnamed protein product [Polarella glacialis]